MPDDPAPAISGITDRPLCRGDGLVYCMVLVISGKFFDDRSPLILFKDDKGLNQIKDTLFITDSPDEHL